MLTAVVPPVAFDSVAVVTEPKPSAIELSTFAVANAPNADEFLAEAFALLPLATELSPLAIVFAPRATAPAPEAFAATPAAIALLPVAPSLL